LPARIKFLTQHPSHDRLDLGHVVGGHGRFPSTAASQSFALLHSHSSP
jgi:hypothetical protein